uniref:Uncharacterized protein n=1 Tax=Arundo donax TaxID=35708 RepID=A0A0A9AD26_ARUDO
MLMCHKNQATALCHTSFS